MADRLPVLYSDPRLPVGPPEIRRDESSLRAILCHIGRLMHEARYIDGLSGSISARLDEARILITPDSLSKGFLQPDQILVCPLDGNVLTSGEAAMHMECYRQRPDIGGVVHAHPPIAVALTIAGVSMRTCVVPEAVITLGLVPTAAFQAPNTPEARDTVRVLIAQHDAILLAHHGSLTVGADVWQAYMRLETLEHTATILHHVAQLGPITPLPPAQVAQLLQMRRQLGYWRPGDDERFCEMCGAC